MKTFALIVGIDAYQERPLGKAVSDARRFHAALLKHGLVEPAGVTLLCSDADAKPLLPTRRNILEALRPLFSPTPAYDRMLFYFAGHGVLTFADAARTIATTALATLDVEDFEKDGDGYIDLRSMVDAFRTTGPAEQFYFIDACRNIAWMRHPSINPGLGYSEQPPGPSRGQEILYAVSHLGEAIEDRTDGGLFTRHLLDGLEGNGLGLLYDPDLDAGLVTANSLVEHVRHHVWRALADVPLWRHKYQLPALEHRDPRPGPLRQIPAPVRQLTVHVEPDRAAGVTDVTLGTGRQVFQGIGWPPTGNHQPLGLAPMRYRLMAQTRSIGTRADPSRRSVDVRLESEVTIRVSSPAPPPGPVGPSAEPAPAEVAIVASTGTMVTVVAQAHEPTVTVRLTRLDRLSAPVNAKGILAVTLEPGAYRVEFVHGSEVVCTGEFVAGPGEHVTVRSTMQRLEVLGGGRADPATLREGIVVSESIGSMQAGALETTLALIGFKPFDRDRLVAGQLDGVPNWRALIPPHDSEDSLVAVVLALEGNGWRQSVGDLVAGTKCRIVDSWGQREHVELRLLPRSLGAAGVDGERIAVGLARLNPSVAFPSLYLKHPLLAKARLSVCVSNGYVTVVTIVARPDGEFRVGQYVLPNPAASVLERFQFEALDLYRGGGLSRWVRALHFAQCALGAPGETLAEYPDVPFYGDIVRGERYDPLLTAEVLSRQSHRRATELSERILLATASRFHISRAGLDESMLAAHLLSGTMGWRIESVMRTMRPALLSTARVLAKVAIEQGYTSAAVLRALEVSEPGALFLMDRIATDVPSPTY